MAFIAFKIVNVVSSDFKSCRTAFITALSTVEARTRLPLANRLKGSQIEACK
jgi:hypothetical protein